jgi:cytochrome c-type biogenesis protein CcmH
VRYAAAAFVAALVLILPAAAAACPKTSVADLEDEVMCPVCNRSLATSGEEPLAVQQRRLIDRLARECKSKDEIKDALVTQYGEAVLAEPEKEGFGLTTYVVPALAFAAGLAAVILAAARWRRRRPGAAAPDRDVESAEAARLEADMRRYEL